MTLNQKAERLMELKSLISSLEKEKAAIEAEFKERGSFDTENYLVAVNEVTRFTMKGVDAVIDAIGEALLIQHDLVKESKFKMLKVSKKTEEAA